MPSTNKTENIGLNAWIETDKPKRSDFVEDNEIIDAVLSEHMSDTDLHLSSAVRAWISQPFVTGVYAGDGTSQGVLLLDFQPSLVLFFKQNDPAFVSSNSVTTVNCGIATRYANSGGISIYQSSVRLTQTQSTAQNGVYYNLNEEYENYFYIAFK